jgi:hypothetical protein
LVDARLELEIEVVEHLHDRKVRNLHVHRDALALLACDFFGEEAVEEVEVRDFLLRGFGEKRIDSLGDVAEAKAREVVDDAGVHEVRHDATSIAAS